MKEDFSVKRGLNKVSQALDDVIPLCVFGNYSAGKSTFINALIGVELLPSGGDPVTAKIYEIRNSEFLDQAKISFEFHGERTEISIEGKEFRVLKGDSETDIVKSIKEEIDNEGSHAYQEQRAMDPETEMDYKYLTNLSNYISPLFTENGDCILFTDYQDQLVEAEARAFANLFSGEEMVA